MQSFLKNKKLLIAIFILCLGFSNQTSNSLSLKNYEESNLLQDFKKQISILDIHQKIKRQNPDKNVKHIFTKVFLIIKESLSKMLKSFNTLKLKIETNEKLKEFLTLLKEANSRKRIFDDNIEEELDSLLTKLESSTNKNDISSAFIQQLNELCGNAQKNLDVLTQLFFQPIKITKLKRKINMKKMIRKKKEMTHIKINKLKRLINT